MRPAIQFTMTVLTMYDFNNHQFLVDQSYDIEEIKTDIYYKETNAHG